MPLADLARRLPDPRAQRFVTHSAEEVLTQQVYQILADYADCNDADASIAYQWQQSADGGSGWSNIGSGSTYQLQENGRRFPPNFLHHSWRDFLYWDTELEAS